LACTKIQHHIKSLATGANLIGLISNSAVFESNHLITLHANVLLGSNYVGHCYASTVVFQTSFLRKHYNTKRVKPRRFVFEVRNSDANRTSGSHIDVKCPSAMGREATLYNIFCEFTAILG